jgi:hypothetical protein
MLGSWHASALGAAAAIKSRVLPYDRFARMYGNMPFVARRTQVVPDQVVLNEDIDASLIPETLVYDFFLLTRMVPDFRALLRLHSRTELPAVSAESRYYFDYIETYLQKVDILFPVTKPADLEIILDEADIYLLLRHYSKSSPVVRQFCLMQIEAFNYQQMIRNMSGTHFLSRDPGLVGRFSIMPDLRIDRAHFETEQTCLPSFLNLPQQSAPTTADIYQAEMSWLSRTLLQNDPDISLLHLILMQKHVRINTTLALQIRDQQWLGQTIDYSF